VKWFVDTSVLVPVFIPGHIHHQRSFDLFSRAQISQAGCAAHSLAEVYATVTRLPGKHRASGEQAVRFLEAIEERFSPVVLNVSEYRAAIRDASGLGVVGGLLYDAIIGACARKARAEVIYSWNTQHFLRLGPEIASRVHSP